MKVVILAGGLGTRITEESATRPKPMADIGEKPILWHIMKIYSHYGFNDFVICAGYKGYMIKEYFHNYWLHNCDVTFDMRTHQAEVHQDANEPWKVTVVDTGADSMTGGRVKRVRPYVGDEPFLLTYGDGVADVNIAELVEFHRASGRAATLTAVQPLGRFGALQLDGSSRVESFAEKPLGDGDWINGGFFVMEPTVFDRIPGDSTILEREPLESLAAEGQLGAFQHRGFWQPMDTLRDKRHLEGLLGERQGALEGLVTRVTDRQLFGGVYEGRRVFVTGHTGFKGSWLVYWLLAMGADITGYSLEPPTNPALFDELRLEERMDHRIGDVRDLAQLRSAMLAAQPDIVFHLAAQPLVRFSYAQPVETFETNVMGSVNVLEAARGVPSVRAVVNVTSDKCYENREWEYAYRENDAMGGFDPYSASKGAAEIVTAAYRQSFFADPAGPALATGRAGNVIGGGDWALDRIVPDCARALAAGEPIQVRNPDAIRPWQHVLEPVSGYLWLASRLFTGAHALEGAWNFGPVAGGNLTVAAVVDGIIAEWGSGSWVGPEPGTASVHEAHFLKLDCAKAVDLLQWRPVWDAAEALSQTTKWYRDFHSGAASAEELTAECLRTYARGAKELRIAWGVESRR